MNYGLLQRNKGKGFAEKSKALILGVTSILVVCSYITQLSHKQMTAGLNHCGENQEEKRSVDNQAGTQFAESNLLKNGRKRV